ncbi:hypothetical protein E2C01_027275 [Portunus trituberculatus]|uniref:Uncharacterized protein n=1 Tax=Portunus trituberculatus TaxID=210409 RepID=A0A5B7EKW6_PORTR|nr:hypothetical protein [Portunus trituberculatus]
MNVSNRTQYGNDTLLILILILTLIPSLSTSSSLITLLYAPPQPHTSGLDILISGGSEREEAQFSLPVLHPPRTADFVLNTQTTRAALPAITTAITEKQ